ncbi:uncharacterized protein LOC118405133 isoform X1 [Branchiostoma floridae]|uniref:Uncharacterized protein LOC118405133 isoform X1 n=1 Tax=Branchiostoma floridae TaxID=7739 RepID=A0A9J7K7Z7_BRAFL|nr:uncharacterized protein LOC118405133 isoform X1 [Branchiostoma floridae]
MHLSYRENAAIDVEGGNSTDEPPERCSQVNVEVKNSAVNHPDTGKEKLSNGAAGSQLVPLEKEGDNSAAKPPDTSEEKLSTGAQGTQLVSLEQGTQNVTVVNYHIKNIYITNSDMVQVGDCNAIQMSQTEVGEDNLEEEEEDASGVEVPTRTAHSQLGTAAGTNTDENTDRHDDSHLEEEDYAAAAPLQQDGPPDPSEVESGAEPEDITAEKRPAVSSTIEEETLSDGLEEEVSPRDGAQGTQDDQSERKPITTDPDVQAISQGVEMLKLDSSSSVETGQGDPVKKKGLLPRLFRSQSASDKTASSEKKEKKQSFIADIKKRLTPQKQSRSAKSSVQRSTSTSSTGVKKGESSMMPRSISYESGRSVVAAAGGKMNPAVPAKPTTGKSASAIKDEERLVSALPNPPSDKLEEKTEKKKQKKTKASSPLAAT